MKCEQCNKAIDAKNVWLEIRGAWRPEVSLIHSSWLEICSYECMAAFCAAKALAGVSEFALTVP